jgi:hypothetical protein
MGKKEVISSPHQMGERLRTPQHHIDTYTESVPEMGKKKVLSSPHQMEERLRTPQHHTDTSSFHRPRRPRGGRAAASRSHTKSSAPLPPGLVTHSGLVSAMPCISSASYEIVTSSPAWFS